MTPVEKNYYEKGKKDGYAIMKEEVMHNAIEWLYNNFYDHPHEKNFVCSENFKSFDDMIKNFTKTINNNGRY